MLLKTIQKSCNSASIVWPLGRVRCHSMVFCCCLQDRRHDQSEDLSLWGQGQLEKQLLLVLGKQALKRAWPKRTSSNRTVSSSIAWNKRLSCVRWSASRAGAIQGAPASLRLQQGERMTDTIHYDHCFDVSCKMGEWEIFKMEKLKVY